MKDRPNSVTVGKADRTLILDPANPLLSAREYLRRRKVEMRYEGTFFRYDGSAYRLRAERSVRADLYRFLEHAQRNDDGDLVPFEPTQRKVDNVVDALRAVINLPDELQAPCWLADDPGIDPFDFISCKNGLLHIPSRSLHPPTPNFYTHQAVPFAFDPEAPSPTNWLRTLDQFWSDDVESQQLWQEWFGYMLTPNNRFQKILLDCGPKRGGKGMRYRVLRQVVGRDSYCSTSLRDLSTDFGMQPLIGKSVAVISDARISGRTDVAAVAENLLRISGEDGPSVRRKHLPDWTGLLSTRFAIISNLLPRLEDPSGALASRFIVLRTTQSWFGREDHGLEARFVPELPGILNWALVGHTRLYERGRFVQPQSAMEMVDQFKALSSAISSFVSEWCEVGAGYEVVKAELYNAWCQWCDGSGRKWPGSAEVFGRDLRAVVPGLGSAQRGPRGPGRVEVYTGVRLVPRPLVADAPGWVR